MFERYEYSIGELQRKLRNILLLGKVEEVRSNEGAYEAKVSLGSEKVVTDWLSVTTIASDVWFPLKKGDCVVLLNSGRINSSVILGTIKRESELLGEEDEIKVKRKAKMSLDIDKFEVKRGADELVSLLIEALEIVADSKVVTFNGPQPLLPASVKLKELTTKLKGFQNA